MRLETVPVGPIAFSPNGRMLATAGLEAIHLWEVATGKEVFQLPRHANFRSSHGASFVSSLVFSPDSKAVATGFPDGTILIWDLGPGTW